MKLLNTSKFTTSLVAIAILLLAPVLAIKPASADPLGQITQYNTTSSYSKPEDIITGPDGNLWFVSDSSAKKIGVMSTSGLVVGGYIIPPGYSYIKDLTIGPNNSVWFDAIGGSTGSAIGRLSQGVFTMYEVPRPPDNSNLFAIGDMVFSDGELWLAAQNSRYLQVFSLDGNFRLIEVSTVGANTPTEKNAYRTSGGIAVNPTNGCLVVPTSYHVNASYIETICSDNSRNLVEVPLNSKGHRITGNNLTFDNDGTLWIAGFVDGWISYMESDGSYHYIELANDTLGPKKGTLGPDNNVWFAVHHRQGSKRSNVIIKIDVTTKTVTEYALPSGSFTNTDGITVGADGNIWFTENSSNRVSKIGVGTVSSTDADGDGLTSIQELQQGTSDFRVDSDNDGLSDYIESQWNTTRDDVFCHPTTSSCEYPDPLQQDVYIETDWMQRPNDGPITGYSTQPSSYSVDLIKTAFANKGIDAHIDTGQLGGGNEVPYEEAVQFAGGHYPGVVDFWDYRDGGDGISRQFATNRKDIYRYMLMGHHMSDTGMTTRTGANVTGTDGIFVSYGLIKENPVGYGLLDIAIAGTMQHELGHSLCLSNTSDYIGQSPSCVFSGVDQDGTTDYPSAMNYLYQMVLVDYSDGTNSSNDHDDWGAISPKDFTFNEALGTPSPGATIEQLKQAEKIRKEKGIKVERKNGKFEVTQTQNGRTKRLN